MATNTGRRKCKHCGVEFTKRRPLDCYCSIECDTANKKGKTKVVAPAKKAVKPYKIKQFSTKNKISLSDGTKMTPDALEKKIHKAKEVKIQEMIDNYGFVFCEDCGQYGENRPKGVNEMDLTIIDCSHEISVKEAKESGRAELACDVDNIRMRCRYHHRIHDKTK